MLADQSGETLSPCQSRCHHFEALIRWEGLSSTEFYYHYPLLLFPLIVLLAFTSGLTCTDKPKSGFGKDLHMENQLGGERKKTELNFPSDSNKNVENLQED